MGGGGPSIEYINATSDFPSLPLVNNIYGAEDRECGRWLSVKGWIRVLCCLCSFTSLCNQSSFSFSDQSIFQRLDWSGSHNPYIKIRFPLVRALVCLFGKTNYP
jgi:hypothetical protein